MGCSHANDWASTVPESAKRQGRRLGSFFDLGLEAEPQSEKRFSRQIGVLAQNAGRISSSRYTSAMGPWRFVSGLRRTATVKSARGEF